MVDFTLSRGSSTGPPPGLRIVLAALAATPFVVVPGLLYPFVVPKAVWFRILVVLGMILLAWSWRWGDPRSAWRGWRRERVGLALAAYVATMALAAALGSEPLTGLLGGMVRMGGVVAWLHYLLFFLLLRATLDGESWPRFLAMAGLVSAAVAGWALLQVYGEDWLGLALLGWDQGRVAATMGVAGPLAAYLLLGASVTGYLASRAERPAARIGWTTVVVLDLWAVGLSGTRAALVAAVVAAAALGAWALVSGRLDSRFWRMAAWALAAGVAVVAGIAFLAEGAFPALRRLLDLGPDSLTSRFPQWRTAWSGFLDRPLLGFGPESFDLVFDHRFRPHDYLAAGASHHDRAHNVLLGALAETGIAGLVAYLAFWGAALASAVRALRTGGVASGTVWLAGGVVAYLVYLMLWFEDLASFHLLLAILAFLEHRRLSATHGDGAGGDGVEGSASVDGGPGGPPSAWRGWVAVGGAVILATGVVWYHAQVVSAAREARAGLSTADPSALFTRFERALDRPLPDLTPVTSRYVGSLNGLTGAVGAGRVSVDSARMRQAFRRAERAVRAEIDDDGPDRSTRHSRLGSLMAARWRFAGETADFRKAVASYRRALEISPGRVRYLHHLARLHIQRGDAGWAMEVLGEALERLPGWWETYDTMARVQWDAGNRERAVELLLRAARTDVRFKTAGTGTQFMVRAGSWLEARGTPLRAVELFEAYLGTRYPGWDEPPGTTVKDVPAGALPIAARLPITLMHTGRIEEAGQAARRLRERLPAHLRRPVVTDRLDRFIADMEAGRTGAWIDRWGVLPTDVPLEE